MITRRPHITVTVTTGLLAACEEADLWMRRHGCPGDFGRWLDAHGRHPLFTSMNRLGSEGDHSGATWDEVLAEIRRTAPRLTVLHFDRDTVFRECLTRLASHIVFVNDHRANVFNVALVEVSDPRGLEIVGALRTTSPDVPVVALSSAREDFRVMAAVSAGCCGYMLKSDPSHVIIDGIRSAASGGSPTSPRMDIVSIMARQRRGRSGVATFGALTDRERQVAVRLCAGLSSKETAADLNISHKTVEVHRTRIGQKTGTRSAVELYIASIWDKSSGLGVQDGA